MHIIAAKAVCFKEALEPAFADYQQQIVANAQRLADGARRRRLPAGQRRHRQSPDAGRRLLEGPHRQGRRGGARQGRHHRQQERHPVRQEPADGGERHPHRHAGGHQARHARAGDGRRSPSFIARALAAPDDDSVAGDGAVGSRSPVPEVPAVSGARRAERRRSRRRSRPTARSPGRSPASSRAPASSRWPTPCRDVFADGGVLLAEAGTGTGKTLAYLVPAILSRQRVLVSTGTKNLQEQIYFKDLPVLREALGIPFTATYMKGRGNYLCLHRFEALARQPARSARCDETPSRSGCIDEWSQRDRDRRPRRDRGPAGRPAVLERHRRDEPRTASAPSARATTTASSPGCGSAPPSPTSSSSTTTCCAPTPRCGRAPSAR